MHCREQAKLGTNGFAPMLGVEIEKALLSILINIVLCWGVTLMAMADDVKAMADDADWFMFYSGFLSDQETEVYYGYAVEHVRIPRIDGEDYDTKPLPLRIPLRIDRPIRRSMWAANTYAVERIRHEIAGCCINQDDRDKVMLAPRGTRVGYLGIALASTYRPPSLGVSITGSAVLRKDIVTAIQQAKLTGLYTCPVLLAMDLEIPWQPGIALPEHSMVERIYDIGGFFADEFKPCDSYVEIWAQTISTDSEKCWYRTVPLSISGVPSDITRATHDYHLPCDQSFDFIMDEHCRLFLSRRAVNVMRPLLDKSVVLRPCHKIK